MTVAGTTGAVLPPMDHAARRDRLRATLEPAGCTVLLVTAPSDVAYLTGFAGSNGAVLVDVDPDRDVLVTDARYRERIADLDVPRAEVARRLGEVVTDLGSRPLGVDVDHVTLAQAARLAAARPEAPLVHTSGLVAPLRAVKDDAELARLRRACAITVEAFVAVGETWLRPGPRERDVAAAFEQALRERGADGVAFPTIVAAGPNGAAPHHEPSDRPLAAGDLVTIDGGAQVDGYRADMTRTLAVGPGGVVARLAEVHAVVEAANAAGRAAAGAGVPVADVDRAARQVVIDAGYGEAFVHPTGHGIGLDVHEAPLVVDPSAASLAVGTTFTVEPGIYLPGVGGVRIEDSLVARAGGSETLTDLPRGPAAR